MNRFTTTKAADISPVTQEDLELINRYSIKALSPDEVFIFNIVLCDNELDRDCERFPVETLHQLAALFIGKTGIFDHNPKGTNQNARIFHTQVADEPGRKTYGGEDYCCLKAKAYMVRTDSNRDLILEIAGGIKKEVSIGFSAASRVCSICGADCLHEPCAHQKGHTYPTAQGEQLCYHSLCNPTDAYEWSFVAVPAQMGAGVVKQFSAAREAALPDGVFKKLTNGSACISLTGEELEHLRQYLCAAESLCKVGKIYLTTLRKEVISYALAAQKNLDPVVLEGVCQRMTAEELVSFRDSFKKAACEKLPLFVQLGGEAEPEPENHPDGDRSFCI